MAESSPTPATPPELPLPPFERINDFPDKLSPMLVKELRQGLRTNTFVVLFLVLQGLLAMLLLIAGPIAASDDGTSGAAGEVVSKIVFTIYALGILVVQPLRGISAVANEIKQNTIDLMVLTRLSAWRIVWGKWSSILSQSALILLAILPYLILRYFFGGMQLVAELTLMLYLFAISGALTAFTVGISAIGSVLLRGLVVVGGSAALMGYILFGAFRGQLDTFLEFLSFTRGDESLAALGLLAITIFASYYFLEIGATAISPAAENRAPRKRLIGLVVLVASYLLLQSVDPVGALIAALLICGLISLDLFSENADFPSIVCRPFQHRGPLVRLLGRLLYPGWATGSLFFVFLVGIVMLLLFLTNPSPKLFTYAAIGIGTLAFPAAMIQLFARNSESRFTIYVTLLLLSGVLALILSLLYSAVSEKLLLWIFSFIPMVLFPIARELTSATNESSVLFISALIAGIYLLIILGGALPRIAAISKLEAELDDEDY